MQILFNVVSRLTGPCLLLFSLFSMQVAAETDASNSEVGSLVRIGCLSHSDMSDARHLSSIIEPVFQRHGIGVRIEKMSPREIESGLRDGSLDGDCARGKGFADDHPDMFAVEPAFRTGYIVVWGRDESISKPLWQQVLGYPQGWHLAEQVARAKGYRRLRGMSGIEIMAAAVARGDIDAFITYQAEVESQFDTFKRHGLVFHRSLLTIPVHLQLNRQYKHLLPELSRAIIQRKAESPYPEYDLGALKKRGHWHIVFSCTLPPKFQAFAEIENFYRRAFARVGYQFSMTSLPRAREIAELLSGRLDGSCARIDSAAYRHNKAIIRLPVSVMQSSPQLISHIPKIRSLRDIPQHESLAYVRGSSIAANILKGERDLTLTEVTSGEIGLKMLMGKRIDYLLDNSVVLTTLLKEFYTDIPLYRHNVGPVAELYPFINSKHGHLAERLTQEIENELQQLPGNTLLQHDVLSSEQ